jgi:hypothetical protein
MPVPTQPQACPPRAWGFLQSSIRRKRGSNRFFCSAESNVDGTVDLTFSVARQRTRVAAPTDDRVRRLVMGPFERQPPSLLRCELAAVGYRAHRSAHGQPSLSRDLRTAIHREPNTTGRHGLCIDVEAGDAAVSPSSGSPAASARAAGRVHRNPATLVTPAV